MDLKIITVLKYTEKTGELLYVECIPNKDINDFELSKPKTMVLSGVNTKTPGRKISTNLFKPDTLYYVSIDETGYMEVYYDCTIFNYSSSEKSLVWNVGTHPNLLRKDIRKFNLSHSQTVYEFLIINKESHKPNDLTKFMVQILCGYYPQHSLPTLVLFYLGKDM